MFRKKLEKKNFGGKKISSVERESEFVINQINSYCFIHPLKLQLS